MAKHLLSFIFCLALTGCASSQFEQALPYTPPAAGTPQAWLSSRLPVKTSHRYTNSLSVVDDLSCKPASLFFVGEFSKPAESAQPVAMVAEKLVTLHYQATFPANRTCDVYARARFEAGRNYALYGGDNIPTGFAGLFDNGTCAFGILDESSKLPLPLTKVASACAK